MVSRRISVASRLQYGQGMTEYIIIVALIAIAAIGVFSMTGKTMRTQVGGLAKELSGQSAKPEIDKSVEWAKGVTGRANDPQGEGMAGYHYANDAKK